MAVAERDAAVVERYVAADERHAAVTQHDIITQQDKYHPYAYGAVRCPHSTTGKATHQHSPTRATRTRSVSVTQRLRLLGDRKALSA